MSRRHLLALLTTAALAAVPSTALAQGAGCTAGGAHAAARALDAAPPAASGVGRKAH